MICLSCLAAENVIFVDGLWFVSHVIWLHIEYGYGCAIFIEQSMLHLGLGMDGLLPLISAKLHVTLQNIHSHT